jgi:hypothetical protein
MPRILSSSLCDISRNFRRTWIVCYSGLPVGNGFRRAPSQRCKYFKHNGNLAKTGSGIVGRTRRGRSSSNCFHALPERVARRASSRGFARHVDFRSAALCVTDGSGADPGALTSSPARQWTWLPFSADIPRHEPSGGISVIADSRRVCGATSPLFDPQFA